MPKTVESVQPIKKKQESIKASNKADKQEAIETRPAPIKDKPEAARSRNKPEPAWVGAPKSEFLKIKVESIDDSGYNSRETVDESSEKFQPLCASVAQMGLVEPIIVTMTEDLRKQKAGLRFELVSGFRRFRALKKVGSRETWAVVHHYTHPTQRIIVNLLENQHREDLRAYEEASAFKKLRDEGFRVATISEKLGISESKVSNYVSCIENLIPELLDIFRKNNADTTLTQLIALSRASEDEQKSFYRNLAGVKPPAAPAEKSKPEKKQKTKSADQMAGFLGDLVRAEGIILDGDEHYFENEHEKKLVEVAMRWARGEIKSFPLLLPPDDLSDQKKRER